ncbi:MAG: hypothetical protein N3E51_03290 [Candidatus Micrarchaeota archaeon]|nr:hypothetical protein [Candidatus Micrarchaeota archaeon]
MPVATRGGTLARSALQQSHSSADAITECRNTYHRLEKETDMVLEEFLAEAEAGAGFYEKLESIGAKIEVAQKKIGKGSDLELNETAILAETLEGELALAARAAAGAALAQSKEEWAGEFEELRDSLEKMALQLGRMQDAQESFDAIETRSAIIAFGKEARRCEERIGKLRRLRQSKQKGAHALLSRTRRQISALKKLVASSMERLSKARLRRKIEEAKAEIKLFMKNGACGRIFIDHKHLTLTAGGHKLRIPMTQTVRFALEEIAKMDGGAFAKASRGEAVISGSFARDEDGLVLRLGKRTVAGDAIIYRERAFRL